MPEHLLEGCRPSPLAHYLKGLGTLRLLSEQRDPTARGHWHNDRFVLRTTLGREDLERFFLEEYAPTPIVAPWNGGSGFHPKDNQAAIRAIAASSSSRLAQYRTTIDEAQAVLQRLGIEKKATKDDKQTLLEACRGSLPDYALDWLDAAFLLTDDGAKYPPLLGTGGNDGRLDFTNNFMQRLLDLFDPESGAPTLVSSPLLSSALLATPTDLLVKGAAIGQFLPGNAGGANATAGFDADSLINPWDFVLMLEGTIMFAAAAVRKMEHDWTGTLSYPFTVRQVGAGYASASRDDESSARAEMWLPLWQHPASSSQLRALFSEGRARVGKRPARNGIDFARAVATLGVDRGISAFERYGFQVRNGLAYFAVPLGRVAVRAERAAGLLQEIDAWLYEFRRAATSATAPASALRALGILERAILALCEHGDRLRVQQVLVALGHSEQAMARSRRWAAASRLRPLPPLSPEWLKGSDDGSIELRLAAALASLWGRYKTREGKTTILALRNHLEPIRTWKVSERFHAEWDPTADADVVWDASDLVSAMNAMLARRLLRATQSGHRTYADHGRPATLTDVAGFIAGQVDERALSDLLWGCTLIDWARVDRTHLPSAGPFSGAEPGALFALLKLCLAGSAVRQVEVPIVSHVHRLAALGQGSRAAEQALRRLRGSGLAPALKALHADGGIARRSAAALLFPVSPKTAGELTRLVLRPEQLTAGSAASSQPETEGVPP